jgi:hypothetical protein
VKEKPFRKDDIFWKIFLNSTNLFRIFFLHNKFISETYLLSINKFWKAAIILGDLNSIY